MDRVIASLEHLGSELDDVTLAAPRRGRKFMSQQERHEVSERMRRYWATRKATDKPDEPRTIKTASAA